MMTTTRPLQVYIRTMLWEDIPDVLDVERTSGWTWNYDDFRNFCFTYQNIMPVSAEFGGSILGYMILNLRKRRYHILGLAVHDNYRRRKVGQQLIGEVVRRLDDKRPRITVDVNEENLGSHLFLKALGFRCTGIWYNDDGPNAYRFRFDMPDCSWRTT